MPEPHALPELLVLQAVRLAGVADRDAILDRAFLAEEQVERILATATATGRVERFTFGNSSGWILTEAGSAYLATLLADDVARHDAAAVLEATLAGFEPLNAHFVAAVTQWQLLSTAATTTGFGAADAEPDPHHAEQLLGSLTGLGAQLRDVLAELTRALPRFGRYPAQYAAALGRAHQDGLGWVTGVGILSCHVVWAELHQDLLASLGRSRLDADQT
jgi:hypothetical protein